MIEVRGVRPFYWGVEYDPPDRRRLCRSWLVEDQAPWRKSIVAFRVRIGGYGLHLGLCRKQRTGERPWNGRYAAPSEIGSWRRLGGEAVGMEESTDGESLPAAVDEVRSPE